MRWLEKLRAGRNGPDQLTIALLIIYWPLSLAGRFTGVTIFGSLSLACLIYAVFRLFSKNKSKRQAENRQFMLLWGPVAERGKRLFLQLRDIRTLSYFRCPDCGKTLRVPVGKGRIAIHCPRCGAVFEKKT
ncbi:MAG: zinc-ribbon domain-containing protein [Peptococcaceae bacterium]|nr:zinc-ribbon domain-containing protein [Peptococcaceae bacterium]